ncbi:phage regulatory protein/antirepressor Ant [Nostoc sp. ChiQUE01b]|uniref:phage regulatory protein/antirepressor Ant n=1 Tax=Nostoc sp. ChiQUE01b TaxID=3075376 RepID=UPI002AD305E2|nr:phage regulatory protein/antirepressor Ant [Nostoc sp. ChiQUE01b]MDZ8259469.1 phage regulatory protein/antirepressor Ant [Nostoc sp. ChiQUE01b]
MTNITIQTINSTLVIDSRLIAAELGIEHRALKKTIQTYQSDFEEFGTLDTVSAESTFGRPETFYYLNEDQSYLSLTYSNNTPQVRQAKVNLVKAFKAAREATIPKPNTDILYLLEQSAAAIREARAQAAIAEEKVALMAPKVDAYDVVLESGKLLSWGEVAKIIDSPNLGRNNLLKVLRGGKILDDNNIPYQSYVNRGFFKVIETDTFAGFKLVSKCTQKGLDYLIKYLKGEGFIIPDKSKAA